MKTFMLAFNAIVIALVVLPSGQVYAKASTSSNDNGCAKRLLISSRDLVKDTEQFLNKIASANLNPANQLALQKTELILLAAQKVVAKSNDGYPLQNEALAAVSAVSKTPNNDETFVLDETQILLRIIYNTVEAKALNGVEVKVMNEACGNNFDIDSFIDSATIAHASEQK